MNSQKSTTRIHKDPLLGSARVPLPGTTIWTHHAQQQGATRIHYVDSLGSITWIHKDPPLGSTKIHHVDQSGHKHNLQGYPIWIRKNVIHQD